MLLYSHHILIYIFPPTRQYMSPKFEHSVHGVPAEFMGISVYDPHHWSQVFTKYLYEYIQNSST